MPRLGNYVSAEIRLFAFYLSNGSLSSLADDILPDDYDVEWVLLEPSLLEQVFAIFANILEIDDTGKVLNSGHVHRRVAQYIRKLFDEDYEVDPPFEAWETKLHI